MRNKYVQHYALGVLTFILTCWLINLYFHQAAIAVPVIMGVVLGAIITIQTQTLARWFFFWRYSEVRMVRCQGEYYHYGMPLAHRKCRTENDEEKEKIAGSALRHPNGLIFTGFSPLRHHHVIRAMDQVGMGGIDNTLDQGFITNTGRYVGRIEAMFIAKKEGQTKETTDSKYQLHSEDVWD